MAILHLLGTGAAISDPHRTTTMLAVNDGISTLVVDCGGDVLQRLLAAGLSLESIDALFITHEHPDHVAGFPLFMEKLWLSGRRRPIQVLGVRQAIEQARRCFIAFDTSSWDDMPSIDWQEIPIEEKTRAFESDSWFVSATPATHSVPTLGLRFKCLASGGTVAYSSDTEPSGKIAMMAREADILVHEATGEGPGIPPAGRPHVSPPKPESDACCWYIFLPLFPKRMSTPHGRFSTSRKWVRRMAYTSSDATSG